MKKENEPECEQLALRASFTILQMHYTQQRFWSDNNREI